MNKQTNKSNFLTKSIILDLLKKVSKMEINAVLFGRDREFFDDEHNITAYLIGFKVEENFNIGLKNEVNLTALINKDDPENLDNEEIIPHKEKIITVSISDILKIENGTYKGKPSFFLLNVTLALMYLQIESRLNSTNIIYNLNQNIEQKVF